MNVADIRQRRLQSLVTRYRSKPDMARAAGVSPDYLYKLLTDGPHRKRLAEDLARKIEINLMLAPFSLDYLSDAEIPLIQADAWPFTFSAERVKRLSIGDRARIEQVIEIFLNICEAGSGTARPRFDVHAIGIKKIMP